MNKTIHLNDKEKELLKELLRKEIIKETQEVFALNARFRAAKIQFKKKRIDELQLLTIKLMEKE
jgi:hypothetical protein